MRVVLFVLGVVLLALIPLGRLYIPSVTVPRPFHGLVISVTGGALVILTAQSHAIDTMPSHYGAFDPDEDGAFEVRLTRVTRFYNSSQMFLPRYERGWGPFAASQFVLWIPLWLLAAVCLAWPVTSFLVRRRRRGRGFEVEANAAGDSAADPPDAAGGRG